MNNKQYKILCKIYEFPTSGQIEWFEIESLFRNLELIIKEKPGSGICVTNGKVLAIFHRPHPGRFALPYQVRDARKFLEKIGIAP